MYNLRMISLPSKFLKFLPSQKPLKLAYYSVNSILFETHCNKKVYPLKICLPENEVISLIKKYPTNESIEWEQMTKTLAENNEDVQNLILRSCLSLRDANVIMSYCKYTIDNGQKLLLVDLFKIIKVLSSCPLREVLQHEKLMIYLFEECKKFINESQMCQNEMVPLFSYIPSCHRECVEMARKNETFEGVEHLICRAFDYDDLSIAWELLEGVDTIQEEIINSFMNYCIRQVIQNNFSVDLIQKFVSYCQRRGCIIYSSNFISSFQSLLSALMYCTDEYNWSISNCTVNPQMECLNCNTVLKELSISQTEFNLMKNALFKAILPDNNIFLKTTSTELKKFKFFLKTCKPFDLVIDGLNIMYGGITGNRLQMHLQAITKFIKEKKKKVLVISRKHSEKKNIFKFLPNAQFFYTENSSDDDVFILYAAMHGGLGTHIITNDFFVTHSSKLDIRMKVLFIKWQLYHQYIVNKKYGFVSPRRHLGLSQCTVCPETGGDCYTWHLTYQKAPAMYSFRIKFNWICLKAIPRKQLRKQKEN